MNGIEQILNVLEGGSGSGNFGHKGRKGKRGGSLPSGKKSLKLYRDGDTLVFHSPEGMNGPRPCHVKWDGKQYEVSKRNYDPGFYGEFQAIGKFNTARGAQKAIEKDMGAKVPRRDFGAEPVKSTSVHTDSDNKLTQDAIINHALAHKPWGKVETDGDTIMLPHKEPAGTGKTVEFWHGTTREWDGVPVHKALQEGNTIKAGLGVFGTGVYLAPGANKSLGYGDEGNGNAMVRVLVKPGKTLVLNGKTQAEVEKFKATIDAERGPLLKSIDGYVKQRQKVEGEYYKKIPDYEQAQKAWQADKRWQDVRKKLDPLLERDNYLFDAALSPVKTYATERGYNSARYLPSRDTQFIAGLKGKPEDQKKFSNEEWVIFDPARISVLSVTYTKHHEIEGH
jgi:hypothetical protein